MNPQRYVDEVLEPHIPPFFRQLEDPLFQQALSHIARRSMDRRMVVM